MIQAASKIQASDTNLYEYHEKDLFFSTYYNYLSLTFSTDHC